MKRFALFTFLAALLISWGNHPLWAGEKKDNELKVYWDNGLRLETEDKEFSFKFGGRIYNDWAFMTQDSAMKSVVGDFPDITTEFRAARLYLSGTIYDKVIFKGEYDFAGGDADFKDVYIGLKDLEGVGTLKAGHFKEPFGLENLTSSRFNPFMERSISNVFSPGRSTGWGVHKVERDDERLTWAFGAFINADDYGNESGTEDNLAITGRITGVVWEDAKDKLLHVGASASYRDATDGTVSFSSTPEAHKALTLVDTGSFTADDEIRYGIEAALVHEDFSVQGEYMGSIVNVPTGSDPEFSGFYVFASYFLTGEGRNYSKKTGAFNRVTPDENVGQDDGTGAWEITARYSSLDLSDSGVSGGELQDFTLGVNCYLNPNTRAMLNYVHADLDTVGKADIVEMRWQVDF